MDSIFKAFSCLLQCFFYQNCASLVKIRVILTSLQSCRRLKFLKNYKTVSWVEVSINNFDRHHSNNNCNPPKIHPQITQFDIQKHTRAQYSPNETSVTKPTISPSFIWTRSENIYGFLFWLRRIPINFPFLSESFLACAADSGTKFHLNTFLPSFIVVSKCVFSSKVAKWINNIEGVPE